MPNGSKNERGWYKLVNLDLSGQRRSFSSAGTLEDFNKAWDNENFAKCWRMVLKTGLPLESRKK